MKYLAFSGHTRSAVWNLETNARLFYMRAFDNICYAPNNTFFLEFPKFEKADREMGALSPVTLQAKSRPVDKDDEVTFFGNVLLRTKRNEKDKRERKNFELTAMDMATQSPLWSHAFPKQGPRVSGAASSGKIVLTWGAKTDRLREELVKEPALQAVWNNANPAATDFFVQVVDAREGKTIGGVVVRTGKYSIIPERIEAAAEWLTVVDNNNRVLLYSVATGEQKARWFGYAPRLSANGERLCLANGRGHLAVYDLRTLQKTRDLYFADPISAHSFSGDGKRLFVLTNDQSVFVIDATAAEQTAAASKAN